MLTLGQRRSDGGMLSGTKAAIWGGLGAERVVIVRCVEKRGLGKKGPRKKGPKKEGA